MKEKKEKKKNEKKSRDVYFPFLTVVFLFVRAAGRSHFLGCLSAVGQMYEFLGKPDM